VTPFLQDGDARVIANSIEALQKIVAKGAPNKEVVAAVQAHLNHDDNRVKSNAIKALWQWEVYDVLQDLLKMLEHADPRPKLSATFALGEIGRALAPTPNDPLAKRIGQLIAEQLAGGSGDSATAVVPPADTPVPTSAPATPAAPVVPAAKGKTPTPAAVATPAQPTPAAAAPEINFEQVVEQATNAFNEKQFDQAEKLYAKVLQANPEHLHALMGVANLYMECKRFDEAALHFEKALSVQPTLVKAHYNLGTIRYFHKDFEKAKHHLLEAIRIYPKILGAYLILAQIFQLHGETAESIDLLSRAIRLNPRNPILYQKLALLLLYERRFPQAAQVLEQAVNLSPLDAESQMMLALTWQTMGDPARGFAAIDDCLRACAQSPRPEETLRSMLRSYINFKTHFSDK